MSEVVTVPQRDDIDRTLVRRAHVQLFTETPECIRYLAKVRDDETETTLNRIRATRLILERTVASVHRIDATAAMMFLPLASGDAQPTASEEDRVRAESLQLLKGILARLDQLTGDQPETRAARPGLVLLRRGDAAG